MRRMFLAATVLIAAHSGALAQSSVFSSLVGEWIGDGMIRSGPEAEPERVYCRVTNEIVEDGTALQQDGRCAVASNSGPIDGLITDLGGGEYGGTLESLATQGAAELSGTGSEGMLVLDTTFIDRLSGEPVEAVTTIEILPEGGYRITSERTNPETGELFTASDILFTPR